MARRHKAEKRMVMPDLRFNNNLVGYMISMVMRGGRKTTSEKVVYAMLDFVGEQTKEDCLEVLIRGVENIKPKIEVKSRRVGGATYQVPVEITSERQLALALRWLIQFSQARKGVPMWKAMGMEVMDAYKNQGNAIKRRDDTHKMAQANKAFAHYKW
ncbi:MAG: 30S ribosomal protein S7 [Kiritimatiellia bacterium]|nr:30S ribosomal protein S7 [Lentisphaerota bacterium]